MNEAVKEAALLPVRSNAGLGLQLVIRNEVLVGIRDSGGFLLFFPSITKYAGQESRYKDELKTQRMLADFILSTLKAPDYDAAAHAAAYPGF